MTQTTPTPPPENGSGPMRVIYIALGVFAGLTVLIFALAVTAAAVWSDGGFAEVVATIRDIMFIFLALEGILIVLTLTILIAQVARLVNLVQNEIQPILKNTQDTVQQAKGTVEFVSKNLSEPVITANRFVVAAGVFTRELFRVRKALRRQNPGPQSSNADSAEEATHAEG